MNTEYRDVHTTEEHRPTVSWGAIAAGAFVAFVANVALLSLGSGIGFTSFDPEQGDTLGKGALLAAGVFTMLATFVALYFGGFVSARLAGYRNRATSALHGLCSWAVVSAVTIVMVALGIGNLAGAALGLVGDGVKGAATAGVQAAGNADLDLNAVRKVRSLLQDTGKEQLNPDQLAAKAKNLPAKAATAQANTPGGGEQAVANEAGQVAGAMDEDAVANVISKRMNISKEDALALIGQSEDQANAVMGTVSAKLKEAGMKTAEASTNAAATASWLTFFTLVLGALAAYAGGHMGSTATYVERETVIRRSPSLA